MMVLTLLMLAKATPCRRKIQKGIKPTLDHARPGQHITNTHPGQFLAQLNTVSLWLSQPGKIKPMSGGRDGAQLWGDRATGWATSRFPSPMRCPPMPPRIPV